MLRPRLPALSAPSARVRRARGATGPARTSRSGAAAALRRRPDPPWPAVRAIAPLRAERTAAFRPPPQWDSADDLDRRVALQANQSDRPPSRMPSVPSLLSRVNRTGKLGACAILSSHRETKSSLSAPSRLLKTVPNPARARLHLREPSRSETRKSLPGGRFAIFRNRHYAADACR